MEIEIKDIAEDLSKYVDGKAKQVDNNNQLQYYICGSVATMLLANTNEIQECSIGDNNIVEFGAVKSISEDANKALTMFQRTIGDLDIMNVTGNIDNVPREYDDKTGRRFSPFCPKMLRRVPNIDRLFKDGKVNFGNDTQEGLDNKGVSKHRVSKIKTKNGNEFYIASPESIIAHKLEEIIHIAGEGIIKQKSIFSGDVKNKYPKDIRDLTTSLNGILKFYDKEKLAVDIREALNETSNSRFIQHQSLIPQIMKIIDEDIESYIDETGLQSEMSLNDIKHVMHSLLEPKKEKVLESGVEATIDTTRTAFINEQVEKLEEITLGRQQDINQDKVKWGIKMELERLEKEIEEIKSRNKRVELDKAWETSWTRKICICILTYIVVIIYSYVVRNYDNILLSSLVPVIRIYIINIIIKIYKKIMGKNI